MHPRISVNPASFPIEYTMDEYLASLQRIGATRAGVRRTMLADEGWDDALGRLEAAGLDVPYLIHRNFYELERPESWEQGNAELRRTVDAAARLGASIYGTTGPGPAVGLTWEQARDAFVAAAPPAAAYARERGVPLMVETAVCQFADYHFLHTLRDTVEVARAAGVGVCVDVHPCWMERDLEATIRDAAPLVDLVQLSDYVLGTRSVDRGVPGNGVAPLERVIATVLDTGYAGPFDLELWGDSGMDDHDALVRGAEHVGRILERLGV